MKYSVHRTNRNFYDYSIILLLALVSFGNIGGALQPIRFLGIFFLPFIVVWVVFKKHSPKLQKIIFLLIVWYLYLALSISWTIDKEQGFKELFYYLVHFTNFFMLIAWAEKANKPKQSIIMGWILVLVLTLPIALYEIITQNHLYTDTFTDELLYIGGEALAYRRASVTFGNLNAYVLILVFSAPFLLSAMFKAKRKRLLGLLVIFGALMYTLLVNASRGGIISILLILATYVFYKKISSTSISIKKIIIRTFAFTIIAYVINRVFSVSDEIFVKLLSRSESGASSFTSDSPRFQIWEASYRVILDTYFLGSGVGSEVPILTKYNASVPNTHNLFIELFMQFGVFIFIGFIYILFRIYYSGIKFGSTEYKVAILGSFLSLLPLSIINSSYLLMPALWVYLSSLYILSDSWDFFQKNQKYSLVKNID
ncbi:O-antigen ligase family protein [Psychrobacter sp. M9-54-1]|uniref:O-antigen ligase family protein n=1 Tax=Psychrobacter sp. M9-54-1 TaxID=2782386 RepID=UPI00190C49C6|nr:O-antigen ligase family protein [Psychrobacter sp. M9-54-1]MBK3394405.1 O-antigen ligase family protein [Psychrobacter sp. M9-54-1]